MNPRASLPALRRTIPAALLRTLCALVLAAGLSPAGAATDLFSSIDLGGATGGCDPSKQSCTGGNGTGGGGLTCAPAVSGAPCDSSGPASQGGTTGGVNMGAGNPINVATGNKYQREIDLPALPGVLGLEIVRHYNSTLSGPDTPNGILGRGWRLSYDTELFVVGRSLQILQADGSRILFSRDPTDPSQCASKDPAHGRVLIEKRRDGETFTWVWPDGRRLDFDTRGRLVQITAPSGEFLTLQRDPRGFLVKVTDPQGRSLRLSYFDNAAARESDRFRGVTAIDSPVGRFGYEYGSAPPAGAEVEPRHLHANLVKVSLPTHLDNTQPAHAYTERGITSSAITRSYHYEDPRHPTLLTGISVVGTGSDGILMNARIATYAYDAAGRAVLSVRGTPARANAPDSGIEQITLDYAPGKAILTNSLGQRTTYDHALVAGEFRLVEVRGAGCASCGPVNVRYDYDARGRLAATTSLAHDGTPLTTTHTAFDTLGRPLRHTRHDWANGRPGAEQLIAHYEYADADTPAGRPALVARPSVIPGREHRVAIRYNAHGQPLAVTESGFAPAVGPDAEPVAIERTTLYRYVSINGRSLLAEFDGPLPNGPRGITEDSDITALEWDARGNRVDAVRAPGGFRSAISYDPATGRTRRISDSESRSTTFAYTPLGELVSTQHDAPGWSRSQRISYRHDAFGQPTEIGYDREDGSYRLRLRQSSDPFGRLQWRANHLGVLLQNRYDTEGRLIESGRYSNSMALVRHYGFDNLGDVIRIADTGGGERSFAHAEEGDDADRASEDRPSARIKHLKDDFGRTIATLSPDSGQTLNTFDAADRLTASSDALGNVASYEYDLAGRIARQTVTERSHEQRSVTAWSYRGRHLIAIEHPTQSERYTYDERGLMIARTIELRPSANEPFVSVTRYTYDDAGRLSSMSMPDGSVVTYARNGQNQVVAITRNPIRTVWLRWLLPDTPLAHDLQRDIVDLKSYTAGNGVEARFMRSREGQLARVLYRAPQDQAEPTMRTRLGDAPLALLGLRSAHAADTLSAMKAAPPMATPDLPGALGAPADPHAFVDHRYLWDRSGNLLHAQSRAAQSAGASSYAYDHRSRLIAAVQAWGGASSASRFFYDAQGRRVLSQQGIADQRDLHTGTQRSSFRRDTHQLLDGGHNRIQYDPSGQPTRSGNREYHWDALGRLQEVRENGAPLARYAYNHRGERIGKSVQGRDLIHLHDNGQLTAEIDASGRITRQYVYLSDQPLAVIDTPDGKPLASAHSGLMEQIVQDLGTAFNTWLGTDEKIVWLHANHLGAIEAASDAGAKVVWQARYAPFGQAHIKAIGFTLNLRLPGQYEDPETGLHYNRHRYYDPSTSRYLTPDPLGTPDGPDPYAYVRNNPLKYIDPSGLILFAFDGTGNDESDPRTFSNVVKFRRLYGDGAYYYIAGPGTRDPATGIENPLYKGGNPADVIKSLTGKERIAAMIDYLDEHSAKVEDDTAFDIDIIGFSRGAAQARDFANQIVGKYRNGYYQYRDNQGKDHCQKVNLRFMGLFDTVLSEHTGSYQLGIPEDFTHVAQAVALNEYRGGLVRFPLESIMGGPAPQDRTRIERGFLGSHSDIGGGFPEQDLSKVALAWMVEQAKTAGIRMNDDPSLHQIAANPVLHDKSTNLLSGGPTPSSEDREVRYMGGTTARQRQANTFGMSWADTTEFIDYKSDPNSIDNISGSVDITAYLQWLDEHHYGIAMTVQ